MILTWGGLVSACLDDHISSSSDADILERRHCCLLGDSVMGASVDDVSVMQRRRPTPEADKHQISRDKESPLIGKMKGVGILGGSART